MQWVVYNFYIIDLVYVLVDLNRISMKFQVESRFGKSQQTEGTHLVYRNYFT